MKKIIKKIIKNIIKNIILLFKIKQLNIINYWKLNNNKIFKYMHHKLKIILKHYYLNKIFSLIK
jgi:hypothetical protein